MAEEDQDKVKALTAEIEASCTEAERSKAFIAMQLDPTIEWAGWPIELAEKWLDRKNPTVDRYFHGLAHINIVGRALRKHLRDAYRPRTGLKPGPKPKEPQAGLEVPLALSEALDGATWDAMRKAGASTDLTAIRQAVKVPAEHDDGEEDTPVVIRSAGTVTGRHLEARYTSIQGDLYWGDIRNSLELWLRARPEHVEAYNAWPGARAWEEGGEWLPVEGGRVEHNPVVLVRSSAYRRALDIILAWKRDGTVSLDALYDARGDDGLIEARRAKPERKQVTGNEHYAWGLRDNVDCYNFPVQASLMW